LELPLEKKQEMVRHQRSVLWSRQCLRLWSPAEPAVAGDGVQRGVAKRSRKQIGDTGN
jgi:hypothetical protein